MRREKLITEIMEHAESIGANKVTLTLIIAFQTDKGLTNFHAKFLKEK